jgi:hypothetical protein
MSNTDQIKRSAFINELHKIAIQKGYSKKDTIDLVKRAAFIDEMKTIPSHGNGFTSIKNFIKLAKKEEYYKPDKWKGIAGFHRAVAEDPKAHQSNEIKGALLGLTPTIIPYALHSRAVVKARQAAQAPTWANRFRSDKAAQILKETTLKGLKKKFLPATIGALILGQIISNKVVGDQYLGKRGVKKDILGQYSFNEQAKQKYL